MSQDTDNLVKDEMTTPQELYEKPMEQDLKHNKLIKKAGWFFLLVMILEIPVSVVISLAQNKVGQGYQVLTSVLLTQGYLLLCGILYLLISRQSMKADRMMRPYKVSSFFLSILLLICASPMASWLNLFSQLFVKNEVSGSIFEITKALPFWLGIIVVGCLPGFIEELLYRGVMYNAFRTHSVLAGVVVSALTFGLMHMNFNQIIYAVYLGVVFALLVEATGSLVSSMVLHMLFNAFNTAQLYILPYLYDFLRKFYPEYANKSLEEMMNQTVEKSAIVSNLIAITPFAIGGLVLVGMLLMVIAKKNGREFGWTYIKSKQDNQSGKPWSIPLILGCLFCVLIAIAQL